MNMCLSYEQLRRLLSKRLESVGCTKMTPARDGGEKSKPETDAAAETGSDGVDVWHNVSHRKPSMSSSLSPSSAAASASTADGASSVEHLLGSIRDLLENRLRSDARRRRQTDNDQQLMNDWVIAAAVLDRICFVALFFLLLAGTTAFLILLLVSP